MIDDKTRQRLSANPAIQAAIALGYDLPSLGPVKLRPHFGNIMMSDAQVEAVGRYHFEVAGLAPDDPRQKSIMDHYNKVQAALSDASAAWDDMQREEANRIPELKRKLADAMERLRVTQNVMNDSRASGKAALKNMPAKDRPRHAAEFEAETAKALANCDAIQKTSDSLTAQLEAAKETA